MKNKNHCDICRTLFDIKKQYCFEAEFGKDVLDYRLCGKCTKKLRKCLLLFKKQSK